MSASASLRLELFSDPWRLRWIGAAFEIDVPIDHERKAIHACLKHRTPARIEIERETDGGTDDAYVYLSAPIIEAGLVDAVSIGVALGCWESDTVLWATYPNLEELIARLK